MQIDEWNTEVDKIPALSLERAEEILRNVFLAAGMEPPENCSEILRGETKGEESTCFRFKNTG